MSDTAEVKTANMETQSALPPEETERVGTEIVAALKTVFATRVRELGGVSNQQKLARIA